MRSGNEDNENLILKLKEWGTHHLTESDLLSDLWGCIYLYFLPPTTKKSFPREICK